MFDGNDEKLNNTQNQADVYALGTMLIRFLYQYYPDEFKEYLSIIAKSRTALYERAKFGKNIRLKQFTKAFGDPEVMQDEFMAFSKAVIAESKLAYIAYKKQKEAKKKSAKKTI